MKKKSLITLLVLLSYHAFSQTHFAPGYFIDNEGQKIECLILNYDWLKNPTTVSYKINEHGPTETFTAFSVSEFGIYDVSKYIARKVQIDRSPTRISELTRSPNPVFREERLFLKVLVEGKASLYSFEDLTANSFFYNVDGSPVEQLIFKLYRTYESGGHITKNNRFRQQLWNTLNCASIERQTFENLSYEKKDLVRIFSAYNTCSNSQFTTFDNRVSRTALYVNVRPRMNYSSLNASNALSRLGDMEWRGKVKPAIGLEMELVLPTNNNKWSLVAEPTYQQFSGTTLAYYFPLEIDVIARVDYASIELPLSVRHYFFLNDDSRIFLNAGLAMDITLSSSRLEVNRENGYPVTGANLKGGNAAAFGLGYKYKALSCEVRYQTERNITTNYIYWTSAYKTMSVIMGYTIKGKKS